MLPANVISALQVMSRSGKPLIEAATDAPKQVNKLEPGQQLQGTVQSQVTEGLFKVQVAGQILQMRLPGKIQSGDVLNLQVVATNPRLVFSISASTNPISTPEQIGSSAKLLSDLAHMPMAKAVIQQAGSGAVWQATGKLPDSKQLAGALRDALANSGLFYESHQAQWVRGERSTAQLLIEPQNQLLDKLPAARQGSRAGAAPVSLQNQLPEKLPEARQGNPSEAAQGPLQGQLPEKLLSLYVTEQASRQQINDLSAPSPAAPQQNKPATEASLPIAKELIPLVQQQLHTLETHQITWAGQVWPGQQMQWEIQGQPERQHHNQKKDERQWSTEMELDLPNLGDVHARLVFAESGLRLTLHAADSETVNLFNRDLAKLKGSLADVGIALTAAVVEKS